MGGCLAGLYSCACCECNFMIFPAPQPSYSQNSFSKTLQYFTNSSGNQVPYLYLPYQNSKLNMIFFHGNAQDIGHTPRFLGPVAQSLKASLYSIEYPTYGSYNVGFPARISNGIKNDSLQFFQYLMRTNPTVINRQNTIIVGRSIGSGGATYLAAQKNMRTLILISPFSDIPGVATDFVGCVGRIVKCHFDNLQELEKFNGRLLVIHGQADQVINCRHGHMIVAQYRKQNPNKCEAVFPQFMTHNHFDYDLDIRDNIVRFIKEGEGK